MQKRAKRADQSVLFFLDGANFWEKHAKNRRKHAKIGENTQKQAKTGAFLVLNFLGENWSVLIFTMLSMLMYARIADNGVDFPQCVSKCAFSD